MKRTSRADFLYRVGGLDGKKYLMIVDQDLGHMSVTNDIENVVADIAAVEHIDPKEHFIVYRDSKGRWDGWDATTEDFFPLRWSQMEQFLADAGPIKAFRAKQN